MEKNTIKIMMKRFIKLFSIRFYIELLSKNWFNLPETIFVNFYFLPFKQAIRLPIWIYGNVRLIKLDGKIKIESSKISSKMITINCTNESPCNSNGNTEVILNSGTLIFKGKAQIGCGCRILVYNNGEIIFGEHFRMNNQNSLSSCNRLQFEKMVVLGHQNQIYDTDFHFIASNHGYAYNSSKPVLLGAYTFISNRVTITKGVTLPPYTIVSANSLVNKTLSIESGNIIGGIPAKLLAQDFYRIRNIKVEASLYKYFKNHPNEKGIQLTEEFNTWTNY